MSPEAARTARELQMLEAMVDCAHALGMAFGEAAKAEADTKRRLELLEAFQKTFLAVRMGIRLSMTLRVPPKAAVLAPERAETPERAEAPERELVEALERGEAPERERDRDYEPVSLPKFLGALGVVARDAERLGDRLPAGDARDALPMLRGLLASATPNPRVPAPAPPQAAGVVVLSRPPQGGTRRKLLGSAAAHPPRPTPRAPSPWTGSG